MVRHVLLLQLQVKLGRALAASVYHKLKPISNCQLPIAVQFSYSLATLRTKNNRTRVGDTTARNDRETGAKLPAREEAEQNLPATSCRAVASLDAGLAKLETPQLSIEQGL
jgi:hypothetical protein